MFVVWLSLLFIIFVQNGVEGGKVLDLYTSKIPGLKVNYKGLSGDCAKYIDHVENRDVTPEWPIRMIDATSKLPSGILQGNILDLGHFEECVNIEHATPTRVVLGKYCPLSLQIPFLDGKIKAMISTCIPEVCSLEEFFNYDSGIQMSSLGIPCQTKMASMGLDAGDYAMIAVLCLVLLLMLLSSLYDFYLMKTETEATHKVLLAFSVISNTKKLLAISNNPDQIPCLNGLRLISMMWVIAGHRFATTESTPSINLFEGLEWKASRKSAYIQGARVSVDTFFFMSAFLFSYSYFKKVDKKPFTYRNIPMLYVHRLFRVTPAVAALYFMQITLLRRLGNGPLWDYVFNMQRDTCLKWWWSFFLYVQNYVNYKDMCIVPTWYLSADMQMFILAPFLILPMGHLVRKKVKHWAYWLCFVLLVVCMVIPALIDVARLNDNEYDTHTRLSIYIIGILFGMAFVDLRNKKMEMKFLPPLLRKTLFQIVNTAVWGIMLAQMLTIIVFTQDVRVHNKPEQLRWNLFHTFSRPAWTVGLCWIVYSCTMGTGGFASWILSRPVFQIFSRLTYSMYLLHNPLITISLGRIRSAINFSDYDIIYYWCGDFIFTLLMSFIWVLAFESPMIILEKFIFGRALAAKPKPTKIEEEPKVTGAAEIEQKLD